MDTILENLMLTRSQNKMVQILSLLEENPKSKDKKTNEQPDEQPDTTNMPKYERKICCSRTTISKRTKYT